jgi:hypothetical protein
LITDNWLPVTCNSLTKGAELESNWIPTQGKPPVPCFRLYGPTDAYFDKTFKLSDFELVKRENPLQDT